MLNDVSDNKNREELTTALVNVTNALRKNPDDFEEKFRFGFLLRELNYFEISIEVFEEILFKEPLHIATLYNICYSLNSLHRHHEAIIFCEKLNEVSEDWYSRMQLAQSYTLIGNVIKSYENKVRAWELGHDYSVF